MLSRDELYVVLYYAWYGAGSEPDSHVKTVMEKFEKWVASRD